MSGQASGSLVDDHSSMAANLLDEGRKYKDEINEKMADLKRRIDMMEVNPNTLETLRNLDQTLTGFLTSTRNVNLVPSRQRIHR